MTNKEKVLSGSIGPLRGNEEALWIASAFKLSVAENMPSFSLAFDTKTGRLFPIWAKLVRHCINLEQFIYRVGYPP